MKRVPIIVGIVALGLLGWVLFGSPPASDGQQVSAEYGAADVPIEVHYSAFNSTFLDLEVAELYGIDRRQRVGAVVVSAYQRDDPGVGVQARVRGTSRNLIGHVRTLRFNEIREGRSAYHISTFPIDPQEPLTFDVEVVIVPTGERHEHTWQQQFWSD